MKASDHTPALAAAPHIDYVARDLLIMSMPTTLKYEPGVIVADGDLVIVHGRFSGFGKPVNGIAADILRIEDGAFVEHWDFIQDEATQEQSKSGKPMFGDSFPVFQRERS